MSLMKDSTLPETLLAKMAFERRRGSSKAAAPCGNGGGGSGSGGKSAAAPAQCSGGGSCLEPATIKSMGAVVLVLHPAHRRAVFVIVVTALRPWSRTEGRQS